MKPLFALLLTATYLSTASASASAHANAATDATATSTGSATNANVSTAVTGGAANTPNAAAATDVSVTASEATRATRANAVTDPHDIATTATGATGSAATAAGTPPLALKVMIVNMFGFEAAPWLEALKPTREIRVPGLSSDYPLVKCSAQAVCEMVTGMGHANAAASMMAVLYSGAFDLRATYFLIAGIAGIDPARGTIGSVAWARYVVDSGIAHEIDAREMPRGWQDGYFGILTDGPDQVPQFAYRTEEFALNEALLQQALAWSKSAVLEDSPDLVEYRRHYPLAPAHQPPAVIQCDTLSADTWWSGNRLGEHARHWTRLLTGGKGVYCTSQQEDNATLNVLTRGAQSGRVDLARVAVLRSGSDFDRPYPHQGVLESMQAQRALPGAGRVAAVNLVLAGMPLVEAIVAHWDVWQQGVPPVSTP